MGASFHLREDTRRTLFTDKLEFHVVELPKLPKELKEDSDEILLWAKFINAEKKEEFDMLAERNPYIEKAYEKLQVISPDREKRLQYEAREKAILDYNQMMLEAREGGLKDGLEQGIEQGIEQGLERGREEGIKAFILDGLEDNLTKERILLKVERHFALTRERAEYYYSLFSGSKGQ